MIKIKQPKYLMAVAALALALAGCKGESPTAPTQTPPGGGGVIPPTGASVTLTVSNANPPVDSTVTITATVTIGNSPAPNGTAVEFNTTNNLGTFTDVNGPKTIRTTTNGVATVPFTSSTAGTAIVTATVNNVTKTTNITFQLKPVTPPPPNTAPTITGFTPQFGRPQGGELVTITGTNFVAPVKVLFDFGAGTTPVEAFPVSVNSTQIQVLTPAVNLGVGQQKTATIVLLNNVGSPNETRVTATGNFTFQAEVLTPKITTLNPDSGPIDGGTKVTIFGEGFQAPMQVHFGTALAQIVSAITFSQFTVLAPAARDTSPSGSTIVTGPVDVTVLNVNSNTSASKTAAFNYKAKMVITAISPTVGSALGGTTVRIDGTGFNDPVTVDIGGVRADNLGVTATQILVRTSRLASPCAILLGPVVVTNIDNGDLATTAGTTQIFSYVPVNPVITTVTSSVSPVTTGSPFTISVQNPGVGLLGDAVVAFKLGALDIVSSPSQITSGTGVQTFSSAVPLNGITFPSIACTVGGNPGTMLGSVTLPVTFTNLTTSCTATSANALTIQPPAPNACLTSPNPTVTTPAGGSCATPGTASVTTVGFPRFTQAPIVITNGANAQPLNITSVAISGANAAEFTINPTTVSNVAANGTANFQLTFTPTTAGAKSATVTFTTNSTISPTLTVCVTATGAP